VGGSDERRHDDGGGRGLRVQGAHGDRAMLPRAQADPNQDDPDASLAAPADRGSREDLRSGALDRASGRTDVRPAVDPDPGDTGGVAGDGIRNRKFSFFPEEQAPSVRVVHAEEFGNQASGAGFGDFASVLIVFFPVGRRHILTCPPNVAWDAAHSPNAFLLTQNWGKKCG